MKIMSMMFKSSHIVMKFWTGCFILLLLIITPVLLHHAMFGTESFDIRDTCEIEASVSNALDLSSMTAVFAKEPHFGGILRKYDLIDVQPYLDDKIEYQADLNCVFWCFEMQLERIERRGGLVTIYVRNGRKNYFYIAAIPIHIKNKCKILKIRNSRRNSRKKFQGNLGTTMYAFFSS